MRKLHHTIALILIDDSRKGEQVQPVQELFAFHLSRAVVVALVINLAALAYLLRDTVASVSGLWNDGIYVLVRMLCPLNFSYSYVPG